MPHYSEKRFVVNEFQTFRLTNDSKKFNSKPNRLCSYSICIILIILMMSISSATNHKNKYGNNYNNEHSKNSECYVVV